MTGTVMAFELDAAEENLLEFLCEMLGLRLRRVMQGEYGQPVGSFVDVLPWMDAPQSDEPLHDKMLVFAYVSDFHLDIILRSMKAEHIAVGSYKAVLTENNAEWNAYTLLEELRREREALT